MEEKYKRYSEDGLSWLYASDIEALLGGFEAPDAPDAHGTTGAESKCGKSKSPVEIFVDELSKTVFSAGGISWDAIDVAVDRACDKAEAAREYGDLGGEMKRLYEKIVKTWIEIYGEEQVNTWLSEIDGSGEDKAEKDAAEADKVIKAPARKGKRCTRL